MISQKQKKTKTPIALPNQTMKNRWENSKKKSNLNEIKIKSSQTSNKFPNFFFATKKVMIKPLFVIKKVQKIRKEKRKTPP
jgi:hypothetical protein